MWARQLEAALSTLGPLERSYLRDAYFKRMLLSEIAAINGVAVAAVSASVAAALRHVALVLELQITHRDGKERGIPD